MIKEIKKNNWTRFAKKFNTENQYRYAQVCVFSQDKQESELLNETPFLGINICKNGRSYESVEFYTGRPDPDFINVPLVAVKQPVGMKVEYNNDGQAQYLCVISEDGSSATVSLNGKRSELCQQYKEQVAYFISERHGFTPGNHVNDWLEAERRIKELEKILV